MDDGRTDAGSCRTVKGFGEFRLIDRIRRIVEPPGPPEVGIGDDAAVLALDGGLLTTDAFVEGVHFDPSTAGWRRIGARVVTAAVSDVAAMGGTPRHLVVCLCIPPEFLLSAFDDLAEGLVRSCESYGARLVGGDTVRTAGPVVVALTVTGETATPPVLRSGASVGDILAVTGTLGGSAGGLEALRMESLASEFPSLVRRHLEPRARVEEGRRLAASGLVTSMIDVTDGLASEVHHLASASHVGVRLRGGQVPIIADVDRLAARLGRDPLEMALESGEEFELLFTVSAQDPAGIDRLVEYVQEKTGTPITQIGEIRPRDEGVVLARSDGTVQPLPPTGYDHF